MRNARARRVTEQRSKFDFIESSAGLSHAVDDWPRLLAIPVRTKGAAAQVLRAFFVELSANVGESKVTRGRKKAWKGAGGRRRRSTAAPLLRACSRRVTARWMMCSSRVINNTVAGLRERTKALYIPPTCEHRVSYLCCECIGNALADYYSNSTRVVGNSSVENYSGRREFRTTRESWYSRFGHGTDRAKEGRDDLVRLLF